MPVATRDFGPLPDGRRATLFTLDNGRGLQAEVCDYGALLASLRAPDARGRAADVVLGYDSAADYKHSFGATIGRFAGPIAGGRFTLEGRPFQLATNGGSYHIHGGKQGFNKQWWTVEPADGPDGPGLLLTRTSPDGEEGYPGTLRVRLRVLLTRAMELRLEYEAETDRPTLCNLTNHSYFNLGGHDSGPALDHRLQLFCDHYCLNDADIIATGPVAEVAGTPMDFRNPRRVGEAIEADFEQLRLCQGYDHHYLLPRDSTGALRKAALLACPQSGRTMEMWTTEPGFQFYAGNSIPAGDRGRAGAVYGPRHGLCLEAQRAPNWPERPGVAGAVLMPGQVYRQITVYRFGAA